MNLYTPLIGSAFVFTTCLAELTPLTMKWGVESTKYFREMEDKIEEDNPPYEMAGTYRFVTRTDEYEHIIMDVFARYNRLWNSFEAKTGDVATRRSKFSQLVAKKDPVLLSYVRDLAPRLYFDFIGSGKEQYVLEEISIRTIAFSEYKGGGFLDKEAWYDIELCHKSGVKNYPVDKKLRFNGSGRTVLRFWSDNYYEGMGMSPMGRYTIDITFNFLVDGRRQSTSTGPFEIDV